MPRIKVVKTFTALYKEVYLVDASNTDEAERMVRNGSARMSHRSFVTTPGTAQPAGHAVSSVVDSSADDDESEYPHAQPGFSQAFCNAQFMTPAGGEHQRVVQENVD